MKLNLVIPKQVSKQLLQVIDWYSSEQPTVSQFFEDEFYRSLRLIEQYPFAFNCRYKRIRIAPVFNFPYVICYEIIGDEIIIVKLIHQHMHPQKRYKR
jgi:hypothetical protein